jgi:type IV secretory pathway VirB2 component (pilin)
MKNFKQTLLGLFAMAATALATAPAFATGSDPISTALASVDLTAVAAAVAVIALVVIGIKLTFKGPDIAGRIIRKV